MEVVLYQNSFMLYCSCVTFSLGMQKNILIRKPGRLCGLLRVLNFIIINFLVLPHSMYDESFLGWMWLFFSEIKKRKKPIIIIKQDSLSTTLTQKCLRCLYLEHGARMACVSPSADSARFTSQRRNTSPLLFGISQTAKKKYHLLRLSLA